MCTFLILFSNGAYLFNTILKQIGYCEDLHLNYLAV